MIPGCVRKEGQSDLHLSTLKGITAPELWFMHAWNAGSCCAVGNEKTQMSKADDLA